EVVQQPLACGYVQLQLLPGFLKIQDVDGLVEHLELLVELADGERPLAALEIGDAEEALLLAADAVRKCAHGNLPGLSMVGRRRTRALVFVPRADFTRVDRAQPETPSGDLEQTAEASDGVDAGLGDERHGKCR